jgi:DNA-directed RNA polymerase subunit beta
MSKSKAVAKTQGNERINFSAAKGKIETPDFLDIQIQSFKAGEDSIIY